MPEEEPRAHIKYRCVPGYPAYRAGTDGSIWSCYKKGPGWNDQNITSRWRRLRASPNKNGYLQVSLCRGGHHKTVLVHQVILETFAGPCPEGLIGRHFPDPDKSNNAITNLQWGTYTQNCEDRDRAGHTAVGERNSNAKITEADVRTIRAAVYRGAVAAMERRFGLSRSTVIAIRKRRTWKHVL